MQVRNLEVCDSSCAAWRYKEAIGLGADAFHSILPLDLSPGNRCGD